MESQLAVGVDVGCHAHRAGIATSFLRREPLGVVFPGPELVERVYRRAP